MPLYNYTAVDSSGKKVSGQKEAKNEAELAHLLRQQGLLLLNTNQGSKRLSLEQINQKVDALASYFRPIGLVEKMFFTRNLAMMVGAGLPLTKALDSLAKQSKHYRFRRIINEVNSSIAKGNGFAQSLRTHERVFGPLYINMIEVGEATGRLVDILKILARQMQKEHTLRRRVIGALTYPAVIIIALFIVGFFMMTYVVPNLTEIIRELDAPLPTSTKVIIAVSDVLSKYSSLAAAGIVAFFVLIWLTVKKTKLGKRVFDTLVIKAPLFGHLVLEYNTARFCRTLSYLVAAGVPIIRSLEITASVLGNSYFRDAALDSSKRIQKGTQLYEILEDHKKIFPPVVLQMIQVGEETGTLSDMLLRMAIFFEAEVSSATKNMSSIIEPILMLLIGGAVGFFAVSMLQPIYSSIGNF